MDKSEQKNTPPYLAYRTFANFLRSLTQLIPNRIDKSAMRSLSGGVQSQLIHTLKYLKLVGPDGTPTERLPALVKAEGAERQKQLRETLMAAYPFLAAGAIDLSKATHQQLEEEFKKLASGDTVRKCIAFFVPAAKDAGMGLSPFIREPGKRTRAPANGRPKKLRGAATGKGADQSAQEKPEQPQYEAPSQLSWHQLLLSKFPSFDPNWSDDIKNNWFKAFNELMQKGNG